MIKIWHQRSTFIRQLYLFKNLYLKVFSLGSSSTNCWVNPFWQIFLWKYRLKKISIEEKKVLRVWERERGDGKRVREGLLLQLQIITYWLYLYTFCLAVIPSSFLYGCGGSLQSRESLLPGGSLQSRGSLQSLTSWDFPKKTWVTLLSIHVPTGRAWYYNTFKKPWQ